MNKYKNQLREILERHETPEAAENTAFVIWPDVIKPMMEELQATQQT